MRNIFNIIVDWSKLLNSYCYTRIDLLPFFGAPSIHISYCMYILSIPYLLLFLPCCIVPDFYSGFKGLCLAFLTYRIYRNLLLNSNNLCEMKAFLLFLFCSLVPYRNQSTAAPGMLRSKVDNAAGLSSFTVINLK